MNTLNVALRDPKVKRTRGELHMMAHDDLVTRDESVKRGGGSVVVLGNSQNNIKVSLRSDISVSPCVVSTNLLCSGTMCDYRAEVFR